MAISRELLDFLVCPKCKKPVEITSDNAWLFCCTCGLKYPIREDIPVMLIDEAVNISDK